MDYTPHTEEDIARMLEVLGAGSVQDLFDQVPPSLRLARPLELPPPMAEVEVADHVARLSGANRPTDRLICFAGGGAYDHYVPAVVRHLAFRGEFATSYTPYQPEASQGVLGALFEYQTMICELTGMEVANASLYDGASALVEGVNLAVGATGRDTIVVSEAVHPHYRQVLESLGAGLGYRFITAAARSGTTEAPSLQDAACLVLGQPNFFGVLEDLAAAAEAAHGAGALLVVSFDPLSGGVIEAPGAQGADVVTGEGQALGNALNYGGPYLGIFATRREHVRRVPGRLVGATLDAGGQPGFVLTLQAREQHIRREKASSNVCTNQTLMAIAAAVYLAWLGPAGLEELGETCLSRAHHASGILSSVPGCSLAFAAPFFKEFVLRVPRCAEAVVAALAEHGYLVGPALGSLFPRMADCLLVAVTERRGLDEIEGLAKALTEVVGADGGSPARHQESGMRYSH
ncbi:MAG: aminomethyl-transferring glycine dehydrogenase subunit GcvPA [Actinomycetota bacterium]